MRELIEQLARQRESNASLMLDFSVLMARSSRRYLLSTDGRGLLQGCSVSKDFAAAITDDGGRFQEEVAEFGQYSRYSFEPADLDEIAQALEIGNLFSYSGAQPASESQSSVTDHLLDGSLLGGIYADEWVFLTTQSWLGSRSKRAFRAFNRAGASSLEIGTELMRTLVARTLKLDSVPSQLDSDLVRRAGLKWLAVGGAAATGLLNPLLGSIAGLASGGYLLMDP
jgi:hypothetical protein